MSGEPSKAEIEAVAIAIAGASDRLFYFENPPPGHEEGRCPDCDDHRTSYRAKAVAVIMAIDLARAKSTAEHQSEEAQIGAPGACRI